MVRTVGVEEELLNENARPVPGVEPGVQLNVNVEPVYDAPETVPFGGVMVGRDDKAKLNATIIGVDVETLAKGGRIAVTY
jgi:hypothetical protein